MRVPTLAPAPPPGIVCLAPVLHCCAESDTMLSYATHAALDIEVHALRLMRWRLRSGSALHCIASARRVSCRLQFLASRPVPPFPLRCAPHRQPTRAGHRRRRRGRSRLSATASVSASPLASRSRVGRIRPFLCTVFAHSSARSSSQCSCRVQDYVLLGLVARALHFMPQCASRRGTPVIRAR